MYKKKCYKIKFRCLKESKCATCFGVDDKCLSCVSDSFSLENNKCVPQPSNVQCHET